MVVRKTRVKLPRMTAKQPVQDIAVITCHFNWNGFVRPVQNLNRFLRQMDAAGISVYGIEAQLEGREFATTSPNWKRIRATENNVMFQKEALLNLAETLVPPQFTKVVWIDADLYFTNPDWLRITSQLLDAFRVVQPFSMAWWTRRDGTIERGKPPASLVGIDQRWRGHPGFAWAAQRSLWSECGGLYIKTPVGHGDTVFASSVLGTDFVRENGSYYGIGANTTAFKAWKAKLAEWSGAKVGTTPGQIYHEWHGEMQDRRYKERSSIIDGIFDSEKHVSLDSQGLLAWTKEAPASMKQQVLEYFRERKEDG